VAKERGQFTHLGLPLSPQAKKTDIHMERADSVATTRTGINDANQSEYELLRILDSEDMSQLEFDAEMSGFMHVALRLLQRRT